MKSFKQVVDMGFDFKEDYKYPLFLFAILSFSFLPDFFSGKMENILRILLFAGVIISSILLLESKSKVKKGIIIVSGLVGIIIQVSNIFIETPVHLRIVGFILLFIMFVVLLQDLLLQLFRSRKITLNVVLGTFSGYILIGIIGFFVTMTIYLFDPESYIISETPMEDLLYYSFITLSTIGYGDITPLSVPAKNIAVIIGIVGQFYNVIIMAAIIGKYLQVQDD